MFQSFGHCFGALCPPGYETASRKENPSSISRKSITNAATKVYQAISPTSMYEVEAPRAYSADLQSPSQVGLPQYSAMSSQRDEKTDFLLVADSGDMPPPLQEKYPTMQPYGPMDHPPAVQEGMQYHRSNAHHFGPKSEGNMTFLKTERSDQNFRATDFPTAFNHSVDGNYSHPALTNPGMSTFSSQPMEGYQPPQFISSNGYTSPEEAAKSESFDCFPLVTQGGSLALMRPNQKPPATKRGPFKDLQKREKTAQVRKIGSCIRCRMQRIRVSRMRKSKAFELVLTMFSSASSTQSHRMATMHPVKVARNLWAIRKSTVCLVGDGSTLILCSKIISRIELDDLGREMRSHNMFECRTRIRGVF